MKQLNLIFSLYSLTAFIIIVERLSPTTKILLPPDNFIRLHEINQTIIFLSISIILSFLILKSVTNNFQTLRTKGSTLLLALFILGAYLFGAGEGWHEVASFTLNQYCNVDHVVGSLCKGLFINDFYAGNIIFFIGGLLMNTSLMIFALKKPSNLFSNNDIYILLLNSIVYAFTWMAYAAFDKVLIGLLFSSILMIISLGFLTVIRKRLREYPYILYSATAYSLATIVSIIIRFLV